MEGFIQKEQFQPHKNINKRVKILMSVIVFGWKLRNRDGNKSQMFKIIAEIIIVEKCFRNNLTLGLICLQIFQENIAIRFR